MDLVGEHLVVNGQVRTAEEYVADLHLVVDAFPDYEWAAQRLVIEDPWISVHFKDSGTHISPYAHR